MTIEQWIERKKAFIDKIEMYLEQKRRGRKPKVYTTLQELLSDGDFRRKLKCTTFAEIESQLNMWL